jgi:hypothetical protein
LIAQFGALRAKELWDMLCVHGAFRDLPQELFASLLRGLGAKEIIFQDATGLILLAPKGERLAEHYSFYAAFSSQEEFRIESDVGTSYAAPKVAHIAARVASLYPEQSSLLHRALVVHSARWPAWAERATLRARLNILRTIGYGLPDIARATDNTVHRVTLISNKTYELGPGDAAIFSVPVPEEIRRPGLESLIRIDVTLSYSAQPRRTRRARTGYLATWLDWIASRRGERENEFRARALIGAGEPPDDEGAAIPWQLALNPRHGVIRGITRHGGTVQRDWAFVQSYDMPETLCIAVRGHSGWASDTIESKAKFALVVGFEAVAGDLSIYIPVRTEIEARALVRAQV